VAARSAVPVIACTKNSRGSARGRPVISQHGRHNGVHLPPLLHPGTNSKRYAMARVK